MGNLEVFDAIEAPEYFYNAVEFEDAGGGMVRVIRYSKRRGVLVPVVSTISTAASLVQLGRDVAVFARKILQEHGGGPH
jgi:hypothetical protein